MKLFIKSFHVLLLSSFSFALTASSSLADGTTFDFVFKEGEFNLKVDQVFPPQISLSHIIDIYSNNSNQADVNEVVDSVSRTNIDPSSGRFVIETRGTKSGVSRSTKLNCKETISKSAWLQNCFLDPAFSDNKKSFINAQFHSSISCTAHEDGTSVRCVFNSDGKPAPINMMLLIKRSPLRLSISGSVENLHTLSALYVMATQPVGAKAAATIAHTQPIGRTIDSMYEQGITHDSKKIRSLRIRGSSGGNSAELSL